MKKNNVVSIAVMAIIALVATVAASAREVRNVNVEDFASCKAHLDSVPGDIIVGNEKKLEDFRIERCVVFLGEDGRVKRRVEIVDDTLAIEAEAAEVNRVFMESYALNSAYLYPWRDYKMAHAIWVGDYAQSIGICENPGLGIMEARNRQGLSVRMGLSAVLMGGKLTPEFSLGGSYSWHEIAKFWLTANVGQMAYGSSLYEGQRYWSAGFSAAAGIKLFQFDRRTLDHHRVYFKVGIRQMYAKIGSETVMLPGMDTNSRIDTWGNDLSGEAGVAYEHDSYGGLNWEVSISYVQNFGGQLNTGARQYGAVVLTGAVELEALRNAISLR